MNPAQWKMVEELMTKNQQLKKEIKQLKDQNQLLETVNSRLLCDL